MHDTITRSPADEAQRFVEEETEFHLGALLTEQPHPFTADLSATIQRDTASGIRLLQAVDQDVLPVAHQTFHGASFAVLVDAMADAVQRGGRVIFSGCGATGRLAILLEAMWRRFWRGSALADRALSIMTGGDFALIRSVEGFEDSQAFGRQQVREHEVGQRDVLVAITEGGETSSVIGTAWQALEAGARVFFVFNNPAEPLAARVERSRRIVAEPRIVKLPLPTGPMAIAGSTRMQATTAELLVVGAALEEVVARLHGADQPPASGFVPLFRSLLAQLAAPAAIDALARYAEFEEGVYRVEGLLTYFADDWLLDILTDTTERNPTFTLPAFRRGDDTVSARSWAFVKHPRLPTPDAWRDLLQREPRGIAWDRAVYERLGAPERVAANPPRLDHAEILKFRIGNEADPTRTAAPDSAAVWLAAGSSAPPPESFAALARPYRRHAVLGVGRAQPPGVPGRLVFHVPVDPPSSPLQLWAHLAVKLALNTISTATMARMGRVEGNWMVYVQSSNKKLIDRSTRLIASLTGLDYASACRALHETMEVVRKTARPGDPPRPAVMATLARLRGGGGGSTAAR